MKAVDIWFTLYYDTKEGIITHKFAINKKIMIFLRRCRAGGSMRYYIADMHFFDGGVMKEMDRRPFGSVEEMHDCMIDRWNKKVKKRDEVFVLGDMFSWKGADVPSINRILAQLRGKIYLVSGNHDGSWLHRDGINLDRFRWIRPYAEITDQNRNVVLCHYPIPFFGKNHMRDAGGKLKTFMVHGHVHDTAEAALLYRFEEMSRREKITTAAGDVESMECNLINCFCGYSDYQPLSLDEWIVLRDRYSTHL